MRIQGKDESGSAEKKKRVGGGRDGGREGRRESDREQASRNSSVGIFATEKIICNYKSRK